MPSKAKDTIVETQAVDTAAWSCGTHGHIKIIVHVIVAFVALFMLLSAFAVGAIVGRFAGNDRERYGMYGSGGTCVYQQKDQSRGGIGNRGPGMMNNGGYGRGMMNDGGYGRGMMNGRQGYYYDQQDSTVPATPDSQQGGANQ